MKRSSRGLASLLAAAAVALTAGCSVNTRFVYKPNAPAPGVAMLPVKVAVLPFRDGTDETAARGSVLSRRQYNLAKAGVSGAVTAITPELWAKSFADDLAASGRFASVRFVYGAPDLADEEFVVSGTVTSAYWGAMFDADDEFALVVSAARRADGKVVWERELARQSRLRDAKRGCGPSAQCLANNYHAAINRSLQAMFAEAGAALHAAVGSLMWSAAGGGVPTAPVASPEATGTTPSAPPDRESADERIDRILEGR